MSRIENGKNKDKVYKYYLLQLNKFHFLTKITPISNRYIRYQTHIISSGCSSISWNKSVFDPQTLVVGCYYNNTITDLSNLIQIFGYSHSLGSFIRLSSLNLNESGHSTSIKQVEWCPKTVDNKHYIASFSIDKSNICNTIIWELNLSFNEKMDNLQISNEVIANRQNKKNVNILRIMWNSTGKELIELDDKEKIYVFNSRK